MSKDNLLPLAAAATSGLLFCIGLIALPLAAATASGLLFGIGLIHSGMANPQKVQAFLDVAGTWDPSLALVMVGAIAVAFPAFQWGRGRAAFVELDQRKIDRPLVVGSLLFGIGWGLSGYCPGPALVATSSGNWEALWYVIAMAVGIVLGEQADGRPQDKTESVPQLTENHK